MKEIAEGVFLFCGSLREDALSASFAALPDLDTKTSGSPLRFSGFTGRR